MPEADEKVRITIKYIQGFALRVDDDGDVSSTQCDGVVCAPTEPEASPLNRLLDQVQSDMEVATRLMHAATGGDCLIACDTSVLVFGAARPLRSVFLDAMLAGGDEAADRCMDVALRIETLGRSCARLTKDVRARKTMLPVVDYLVDAIGMRARDTLVDSDRGQTVVRIAATDAWMPVVDIARAAGRTCSPMLLQRAHSEARRRAQECTRITGSTRLAREQECLMGRPLHNYVTAAMFALKVFAEGMCNPMCGLVEHDWMSLCRGTLRSILRTLRRAIEVGRASFWPMPALDSIHGAREALALGVDVATGDRRGALVCTLALLTTIVSVHQEGVIEEDTPLKKMCLKLQDPTDPARAIVLEGLDITGTSDDAAGSSLDRQAAPCHPQDDLLSRAWDHHPSIFTAILERVDPWDVGSVALASRTHYMRIVRLLRSQDCDDTRPNGGLVGTALSATIWVQRNLDSCAYEPVAERVEPSPGRGTLPDLRLLLFLCRFMTRLDAMDLNSHESRLMTGFTVACALRCGGAIARCIDRLGFNDVPCDLWQRREHESRIESLAGKAGFHASPLAMRVAIAESFRLAAWNGRCPEGSAPNVRVGHTLFIVTAMMSGIVRGLYSAKAPISRCRSDDLSMLVDVLCTFLAGVRHDMDAGRTDMGTSICKTFRAKAMALLAPGIVLPEPSLRTRLALALLEASRPVQLIEHP
nr:hypothetical protein [Pandoravirus massiliensis]